MMKIINFSSILFVLTTISCTQKVEDKERDTSPIIIGAMKNVMWDGQLNGIIDLDTIENREDLFGLGPIENLSGEIMIFNGKSYKSIVLNDSTMKVSKTYQVKAPFFGFANIKNWEKKKLTDSIQSIKQLENYLVQARENNKPFFFKISTMVEDATVHVVNLPKGSHVSSPEEAHKGQKNFSIKNKKVDILGFFSTEHKTIFTHHNTFLHMHLLTIDRSIMGHLDSLSIKKGSAKLYIQKQ